jgi:hypothetical protein
MIARTLQVHNEAQAQAQAQAQVQAQAVNHLPVSATIPIQGPLISRSINTPMTNQEVPNVITMSADDDHSQYLPVTESPPGLVWDRGEHKKVVGYRKIGFMTWVLLKSPGTNPEYKGLVRHELIPEKHCKAALDYYKATGGREMVIAPNQARTSRGPLLQ